MNDGAQGRQRLKPWLISKIESETIPGLNWIDRNQKIFRISWKRNGTSEWATEDSAIFRDWAIHTGKYRQGIDKTDYPYWKTRLRCAFNKHQEIIELKQYNQSEGNDPYRVYQILDNAIHNEPLPTQDNSVEMVEDFKSPMDMDTGLSMWNQTQMNLQNIHNIKEIFHNSVAELATSGTMDSDLKNINSMDLLNMSSEEYREIQTNLEVIIRFQTEQLVIISVKNCCFLTTGDFAESPCQVIKLPEVEPKTEKLMSIISVIWTSMKDGIYIKVDENNNILALRLCKCRIYYRNQNSDHGLKLERSDGSTWTTIFNYQQFFDEMPRNPSIKPDVTLYIGQKGDLNPSNVFYSVSICHLLAKQIQSNWNINHNNKISISI